MAARRRPRLPRARGPALRPLLPPNLLHSFGPLPLMVMLVLLLHLLGGAAGMALLGRAFGMRREAAAVAGVAWALSGFVASLWTNGLRLPAGAWIPWQGLAFVHLAGALSAGRPWRRAAAAAAAGSGRRAAGWRGLRRRHGHRPRPRVGRGLGAGSAGVPRPRPFLRGDSGGGSWRPRGSPSPRVSRSGWSASCRRRARWGAPSAAPGSQPITPSSVRCTRRGCSSSPSPAVSARPGSSARRRRGRARSSTGVRSA